MNEGVSAVSGIRDRWFSKVANPEIDGPSVPVGVAADQNPAPVVPAASALPSTPSRL